MAETALNPAPVGVGNDVLSASYVNSFRISAAAARLGLLIGGTGKKGSEFVDLCLSLARGLDYAIANQEVPAKAQDLPILLKQVCQRKNNPILQAGIMVLMISVKCACDRGWFSQKDSEELITLANEIASSFCSTKDLKTEASSSYHIISNIMSRFYPQLKMGQIVGFLEVKPGYGAYAVDFQIRKNENSSPEDKIRLLVAQTDNIETSACIISPPQVSFLLNGKGVDKRTNVFMGSGPQIPTVVTRMLKYGSNLLQVVGQFNGNYIIAVALMSEVSIPEKPNLQDYVRPSIASLDSESDIIEGASRISLNCPISFRHIRTPVKGQSCKHLQCFDFENYVGMNSRLPYWRCPHCNQYVCFTDIRIDRNMVKVLNNVGNKVSDVMVSANGSLESIIESEDQTDETLNTNPSNNKQEPINLLSDDPLDILDLMDEIDDEDRKPSLSTNKTPTTTLCPNSSSNLDDDFWSGLSFPTVDSGITTGGVQAETPTVPVNVRSRPLEFENLTVGNERSSRSHLAPLFGPFTSSHYSVVQNKSQPSEFENPAVGNERSSRSHLPSRFDSLRSLLNQYSGVQNSDHRDRSSTPGQDRLPNMAYLPVPRHPSPRPVSPSPHLYTSTHSPQPQFHQRGGTQDPTIQTPPPGPSSTDTVAEMDWRPTGRMRGSLSGQAYSEARNQFIYQPVQATVRPTLPSSNQTTPSVVSFNIHMSNKYPPPANK